MAGRGAARALAFSPDGQRLAAGTDGGDLALLDPRTGAVLKRWVLARPVNALVFERSGGALLAGLGSGVAARIGLD